MGEMFHYIEGLTLVTSESAVIYDIPVVKESIQFYQVFTFLDHVAKSPVVIFNWNACLQNYPVSLCTSSTLETHGRKKQKKNNVQRI